MNRSFSIYLEIARIFATLIVFGAHSFVFYHPLAALSDITQLGRDGVIVFFVLSGFVITWCANERERTPVEFAINRASRIYSVAIPGIILGVAASLFLSAYAQQSYPYALSKPWLYFPIYLTFTGYFFHLHETPPCNFPYWSLNLEVWYYIIFAIFFYSRNRLRWLFIAGILAMVGPYTTQLLPLWLAGSALYYARQRIQIPEKTARLGILITCTLYVLVKVFAVDNWLDGYNSMVWKVLFHSDNGPRQLLGDYLLGLLVVINFVCALQANFRFDERAEHWIKLLASYSFSFYLFHIPIFSVLQAVIPDNRSPLLYILIVAATALTIVGLARVTEHKKGLYRNFFRKLLGSRFQGR